MATVKQKWLMFFSVLLIVAVQVCLFVAMQKYQTRKPDFAALYQAGRTLLHGRFPAIVRHYPTLNDKDHVVEFSNGLYPEDTMHPPFEMLIYTSLALFKFKVAYPLWWGCNLLFLYYTAFLLWRHVPNLQANYPYLLIVTATFFPVLVAFVQGQNSVLLLVLLALCCNSLADQKHFRAGLALSMGMFKFVLVLPILLWLILERRWKSVAGFAVGCAVLLLTSVWLVGIGGVENYIRMIAGYGKAAPERPGTESIMPNLRGLLHTAGGGFTPEIVLTLITLICSLGLLIWVDTRDSKQRDLRVRFAVQVFLASLVSYHLYPHDAAILILPMVLILDYVLSEGTSRRFRTAVVVATSCVYLVPFVTPLQICMPLIGISSLILLFWLQYAAPVEVMQAVSP